MGSMIRPVAESFGFTHFMMNLVTGDLTEENAVRRIRGDAGPSISWIAGHLIHYRYQVMNLLGKEKESPFTEEFARNGAGDGSGYPTIQELREHWDRIHAELQGVFEGVRDEQLLNPMPGDGSAHGEKKVLDTLNFFMWHESYHMGQLGTLRAHYGLTATATLATEASQAKA